MCRDTAVLKQYVIYLYGGAFILAIILWMGSKLNRYILNKLWISMLASLIMAGVIAQMLNQKYDLKNLKRKNYGKRSMKLVWRLE